MQQTIVALCLATLNAQTGNMHQSDKDFFDEHVQEVSDLDAQAAVEYLVDKRLNQFAVVTL